MKCLPDVSMYFSFVQALKIGHNVDSASKPCVLVSEKDKYPQRDVLQLIAMGVNSKKVNFSFCLLLLEVTPATTIRKTPEDAY